MYTAGVTNENYLRAVQVADANGVVTFRSIFPGTYSGRWPHAHFEVYENLAAASSSRNARATSQLALPEDVCRAVYATDSGYSQSIPNLDRLTLATDNIFRDGWALQLASMTGNTAAGYVASLLVGV
jgi:protocatechuate 3,4-dioxygenase beta subunit